MPSDWKTFTPTRLPLNSKHITVAPYGLYVSDALIVEMDGPDYVKVKTSEKLQAFSVTPVAESDPATVRISSHGRIRSTELAASILAALKTEHVRLKAQKNPTRNSWVFQLKPAKEED